MPQPHHARKPPYPWYEAYLSALFEVEKDSLESRITQAERELVARERQLFRAEGVEERRAVIAALRALTVLRICQRQQRDQT